MDPITAIGLLGSLANLIQASNEALKLAKAFKDGDREITELLNDISIFQEALKGFDRILRSRHAKHNISTEVINRALADASATFQEMDDRLQEMSRSDISAVRRMKWVQNKSGLKKLHERLKGQSTMLQSFLALAHTFVFFIAMRLQSLTYRLCSETFLFACSQHPEFLQIRSRSADEVATVTTAVAKESSIKAAERPHLGSVQLRPCSTNDVRRHSVSTQASALSESTSSISTNQSSVYSARRKSKDTAASSIDEDDSLERVRSDVSGETGGGTKSRSNVAGPLAIRKACRYDCFCDCHTWEAASQRGRRGSKPVCTDLTCKAASSAPEQAAASNSKFFRKALSQIMASKSIRVRYDLGTFRIVAEGSDAVRFVKHGNLDGLKASLKSGDATLYDTTVTDGWSLLHQAVYSCQLPIVKYLIEAGGDTEVTDMGSRKPADFAIFKSLADDATHIEREMVELFSQKDDHVKDFEFTPIHTAALNLYEAGDVERPSLEQLIELVDDCNNSKPGTDWAKWKSRYKKRSPLFGDILEVFRASAFEKPKSTKIIHNLIDQKDKKNHWTPLHWAISAGQKDKVRILINHGADPFVLSNLQANILHTAAESKAVGVIDEALKLQKRFPEQLDINKPNHWGETPLHVASWGALDCVTKLLDAGADRNVQQGEGQVALHYCALSERGDTRRKIASILTGGDSSSSINIQDIDGRPSLFDFLDDPICVETLVSCGARLDLLDESGKSVFHHACIQDENASLQMLLRHSPPGSVMPTVKDHDGNTALIQALRHRSPSCATTLLLGLDDPGDFVGQHGWTVAHHTAKLGNAEVLEAALKHPKFVRGMKTIDGKTVEVVAMEAGHWQGEVKLLLREYNAIT